MSQTFRLSALISSLHAGSTDEEIVAVINGIRSESRLEIVAELAKTLAASGERLSFNDDLTADVASTGGPSSLSTLLTPLYLCAWGATVPKLGVPGRPAGGIDCLAQIPGYTIHLDKAAVSLVIDRCGYAHFLADGSIAPLDGRMFYLRQTIGAQDVPALVTASLLAKKLAVGVRRAGLDIRVAPWGNFGRKWAEARSNAYMFREVASMLDITAYPVLTDARFPYQPFIGRAESMVAIHQVFQGRAAGDLLRHADLCCSLAAMVLSDRSQLPRVSGSDLQDIFYRHIESQGAHPEEFERLVNSTVSKHRLVLKAPKSGFYRFSISKLRDLLVEAQRSAVRESGIFPDPMGVILLHPFGSWANAGDPLASVRADDALWSLRGGEITKTLTETGDLPTGPGFEGTQDG